MEEGRNSKIIPGSFENGIKNGIAGSFVKKLLGMPKGFLKKLLPCGKFKNWVKGGLSD